MLVLLLWGLSSNNALANIFASGIRISNSIVTDYNNAGNSWDGIMNDGSGVKIWFIINESGVGTLSSTVTIKQGATTIKTLTVSSPAKGVNSVIWDGSDNSSNPAPTGTYIFEVTVSDPTGHSSFDSLWRAGARLDGNDLENLTNYAYRGTAAIIYQSDSAFGRIYVGRGTTTLNGIYELRADGTYLKKIATSPVWVASTPIHLVALQGQIYAGGGYGFTGGNYVRCIDAASNTVVDSALIQASANYRGLVVKIEASDTVYYSCIGGTANSNWVVRKAGVAGAVTNLFKIDNELTTPGTSTGYMKALAIDDDGNFYVAFGDLSASRKKLGKYNSSGVLQWVKALDTDGGLTGTPIYEDITIYHGSNSATAADDKLYVLVHSTSTVANRGIYSIDLATGAMTQLTINATTSTSASALMLNTDVVGNVIWSNGASVERIVVYSPADGANSHTTLNPTGYGIVITTALPVELTSFTAASRGKNVELTWSTATETNNAGFSVERKAVGADWQIVTFIKGQGMSNKPVSYSYTDNVAAGRYTYRLKQVDQNGAFKYSSSVETVVESAPTVFGLAQNYPNPFNPTTMIRFAVATAQKVTLRIYNTAGQEVTTLFEGTANARAMYEVPFNAGSLASGMYFSVLQTATSREVKKMTLLR